MKKHTLETLVDWLPVFVVFAILMTVIAMLLLDLKSAHQNERELSRQLYQTKQGSK